MSQRESGRRSSSEFRCSYIRPLSGTVTSHLALASLCWYTDTVFITLLCWCLFDVLSIIFYCRLFTDLCNTIILSYTQLPDVINIHAIFFFYHLIRPEHGVPDMETSNYAAANTLLYCVQSIGCLWEGGYFHIIRNTLS